MCPGCILQDHEATFRFGVTVFIAFVIVGAIIFHYNQDILFGWGAVFFGSFCLTWIVVVVPHELGHALGGLAVGLRLFTVSIGASGRVVRVWRIVGYDVAIYSVVLGGGVLSAPKDLRWVRLRKFISGSSGPLADVLLIVGALTLLDRFSHQEVMFWVLSAFVYGVGFRLAYGLIPRMGWHKRRLIPNDGLNLLRIPRIPRETLEAWHSTTFYLEVLEAIERDKLEAAHVWLAKGMELYPKNTSNQFARIKILIHQRRHREARDAYLAALEQGELSPENGAAVRCNVAWLDLLIGDRTLLDEADRLSLQALEADPWTPGVKGTRGSVLIELGRIDEGIPLVRQALRENYEASNKAANACYLAIAMARGGDPHQAQAFLNEAKRRDPGYLLIERTERQLNQDQVATEPKAVGQGAP